MNDSSICLTARETEVAQLVADGFSYQAIGERLSISLSTVKRHIENIYEKLNVHNQRQLARLWYSANGEYSRFTTSHSDRTLVTRHSVSGPSHEEGYPLHIQIGEKVNYLGTSWYVAEFETDDDGYPGVIIHHVDMPDFDTLEEALAYEVPSCFIRLSLLENGMTAAA